MHKPLFRYTIGNVNKSGFDCLFKSIENLIKIYNADIMICHNNLNSEQIKLLETTKLTLHKQSRYLSSEIKGVAWKLCPPRLNPKGYEIFIDNDIIIEKPIDSIDKFLSSDYNLMLEDHGRMYGRFDRHVPKNLHINSGLFGLRPEFEFEKYLNFYGFCNLKNNAVGGYKENFTFDEQGIVATILSLIDKYAIIPIVDLTNCESRFIPGKGMHFVGLNRKKVHRPWREYLFSKRKIFV